MCLTVYASAFGENTSDIERPRAYSAFYQQSAPSERDIKIAQATTVSGKKAFTGAVINAPHRGPYHAGPGLFDNTVTVDMTVMLPWKKRTTGALSTGPDRDSIKSDYYLERLYPQSWTQEARTSAPDKNFNRGAMAPFKALSKAAPGDSSLPEDRTTLDRIPAEPQSGYSHFSIVVSHSRHTLQLVAHPFNGPDETLFKCRVGLGAINEFPTPKGVYYVTHIYDDDPWWIPPKNRPWAWGQRPSRTVYGGIMAPLLKKRIVRKYRRSRRSLSEDYIAGKVRLNDYGYRFHGTNAPRSIGRNESHGCVRMLPKDVKKLAALIKKYVGTGVRDQSENGTFVMLKAPVRLTIVR